MGSAREISEELGLDGGELLGDARGRLESVFAFLRDEGSSPPSSEEPLPRLDPPRLLGTPWFKALAAPLRIRAGLPPMPGKPNCATADVDVSIVANATATHDAKGSSFFAETMKTPVARSKCNAH